MECRLTLVLLLFRSEARSSGVLIGSCVAVTPETRISGVQSGSCVAVIPFGDPCNLRCLAPPAPHFP